MSLYLFIGTALTSFLFPSIPIALFSPFLVYTIYNKTFTSSLWWSFWVGMVLEMTAYNQHFGWIPLTLVATTFFLYDKQKHFFRDNFSTYPIMTTLYSLISTLLLALILQIPLTLSWISTDLILMPLLDGAFAFLFYTLPFLMWGPKRRRGEEYFTT